MFLNFQTKFCFEHSHGSPRGDPCWKLINSPHLFKVYLFINIINKIGQKVQKGLLKKVTKRETRTSMKSTSTKTKTIIVLKLIMLMLAMITDVVIRNWYTKIRTCSQDFGASLRPSSRTSCPSLRLARRSFDPLTRWCW